MFVTGTSGSTVWKMSVHDIREPDRIKKKQEEHNKTLSVQSSEKNNFFDYYFQFYIILPI